MNKTEIVIVLDRSGSMTDRRAETVHAVNKFIAEQKLIPGEASFSLVTFSTTIHQFCAAMPLHMVPMMSAEAYVPDGYTALLDAIGETIDNVGRALASKPEPERADKVVFVVITDGHENASRTFELPEIRAKISHQRDKYNWQFLFLGAGPETFADANTMGLSYMSTMSWEPQSGGVLRGMIATNQAVSSYRSGDTSNAVYNAQHRVDNNSK